MIRRAIANAQLLSAGIVGTSIQQRWVRTVKYWQGNEQLKKLGKPARKSPLELMKIKRRKRKRRHRKKMWDKYRDSGTYREWVKQRSHSPRASGTRKIIKEDVFVKCLKRYIDNNTIVG